MTAARHFIEPSNQGQVCCQYVAPLSQEFGRQILNSARPARSCVVWCGDFSSNLNCFEPARIEILNYNYNPYIFVNVFKESSLSFLQSDVDLYCICDKTIAGDAPVWYLTELCARCKIFRQSRELIAPLDRQITNNSEIGSG